MKPQAGTQNWLKPPNRQTIIDPPDMGRQMYFYYLEWLFVYNQNKYGYM